VRPLPQREQPDVRAFSSGMAYELLQWARRGGAYSSAGECARSAAGIDTPAVWIGISPGPPRWAITANGETRVC
jgi:hypothetical protein